MIGITPQGTISYILECVGGRMSDKEIVEQSSLLQHDMICWVFVSANIFGVCTAGDTFWLIEDSPEMNMLEWQWQK